jgi:hypothetical protein
MKVETLEPVDAVVDALIVHLRRAGSWRVR